MNSRYKFIVAALAFCAAHPVTAVDAPPAASHPLDLTPAAAVPSGREKISDAHVHTRLDATLQADGSVLLHCEQTHDARTVRETRPGKEQ